MLEKVLQNLRIASLNAMQQSTLDAPAERDLLLLSPTGSGKTLAFLLPVLERLRAGQKGVQALVLVPSRELALQIEQVFRQMGTGHKVNCCYGGHAVKTELHNLSEPPALLIGTPGRVAFHVRKRTFDATTIETLVLDEFDKSLELGFQTDMAFIVRELTRLQKRILTSATNLAELPDFTGLRNPTMINYLTDAPSRPDLRLKAVRAESTEKIEVLFSLLCKIGTQATLVFCNHRDAVERISELLRYHGLEHGIFHGGLEQPDRERALMKFRNGSHRLLITTDLASRGLDIPEIENVVHYQLPTSQEAFVHRNGRTARMHASGTAYLILTTDEEVPTYLPEVPELEVLPDEDILPPATDWDTLYLSAGKKDKVNKVDIVGLLLQKGGLQKDELGLIEVQDNASFAAVRRSRIEEVLRRVKNEKIKGQRIKIDLAR
ncbi:DEAD/DEAH box helicase [Rhabdobacter roseus]|uniref:ATP-independent RNA helicase DbpA n=1 Tax=Rhabdobacter roseus TaxID=1655419 RepID=A0A840TY73_9BACT|nr:DEAD/DEAH box helicase [Rhabdobacter roseus]MBB5286243.1 ATP-independent RNA helicase DbpA [Rhabdobacter roseus]